MNTNTPQYVTGGNVIAYNPPQPVKVIPRIPGLLFNITAIVGSITGGISFLALPIGVVFGLFPASVSNAVTITWVVNLGLLIGALAGNFWVDYRYKISQI